LTKEEALKLALEALTYIHSETSTEEDALIDEAITAIKEALAQPAQGWKLREVYFDEHGEPTMHKEPARGPFGWYSAQEDEFMTDKIRKDHERLNSYTHIHGKFDLPLYTTPPQRPWVGLTQEQFTESARLAEDGNYLVAFQRIQQWLKEKNT